MAAVRQVPEHGADLVEALCLVGGHVVDGAVCTVHAGPAQVGEREAFLERGAFDDLGPRVEQAAYVRGHDGEVGAHDARSAEADRGAQDGAQVRDAHVQLPRHRVQHAHVRDVAVPVGRDGADGPAARGAVDELHDGDLEPEREVFAVQRLRRHAAVHVAGPDAEVVGREVDLATLAGAWASDAPEPLRVVGRGEGRDVFALRVGRVAAPGHTACRAAQFAERGRVVEELGDAFARPELAGGLLTNVSSVAGVRGVGYRLECADVS